jgi:hypothetical protein
MDPQRTLLVDIWPVRWKSLFGGGEREARSGKRGAASVVRLSACHTTPRAFPDQDATLYLRATDWSPYQSGRRYSICLTYETAIYQVRKVSVAMAGEDLSGLLTVSRVLTSG